MNNNREKFKKAFDESRLTAAEKASMRSDLSAFMVENPIKAPKSSGFYSYPSKIVVYVSQMVVRAPVPVFLALFLFVGVSTSYAAGGALPGSLLYPIKVGINEKIESSLAFSTEEKTKVEVSHATLRLTEAEVLKEKGELTPEVNVQLQKRLSVNVDAIGRSIEKLKKDRNENAVASVQEKIEKDFDEHLDTLITLSGEGEKSLSTSSRPLVGGVVHKLLQRRDAREENRRKSEKRREETRETPETRSRGEARVKEAREEEIESVHANTTEEIETPHTEVEVVASSTIDIDDERKEGIIKRIEDLFEKRRSGSRSERD